MTARLCSYINSTNNPKFTSDQVAKKVTEYTVGSESGENEERNNIVCPSNSVSNAMFSI